MKAILLTSGNGTLQLEDWEEPSVRNDHDVKLRVLEVGICGTDRQEVQEAEQGKVDAPPGQHALVIGHEMFGQVVEVGDAVTAVQPGNFAVFSVRRGCGKCQACAMDRSDMCYTGDYTERGIKERDGYQTQYVVDDERYVTKVPDSLTDFAVLCEPLTVSEKAIDDAVRIQVSQLPDVRDASTWLRGKRVLIAGLGPVGLLAAFAFRIRDAEVIGLDVVDAGTNRPNVLERIGGRYVDGRTCPPAKLGDVFGQIDLIFEATGVPKLEFNLLEPLGINGIYIVTGVPESDRLVSINGGTLIRNLVLKNQVMLGSVNAAPMHFKMAVADLERFEAKWPDAIRQVITNKVPYNKFNGVFTSHPPDEIKTVIEWK